jgi:aubergine-like protein
VDDVDFNHSPRATFTTSNGETISYLEYYRRQYDITIEDDEQPLLIHRPKVLSAHESEVEKLIMLVPGRAIHQICLTTQLLKR